MSNKPIYIGKHRTKKNENKVSGKYVFIENEQFYKIEHYDRMDPFFMSIVSDSDHWMYIWSNGALSAGRKNADNALFPYYTDDKIRDGAETTGSKTIILIEEENKRLLWEPFSDRYAGLYSIERHCYKNILGNKLIFEEINFDLQLTFRYAWMNSEKYGFIKRSHIFNNSGRLTQLNIVDGIQNILPYGLTQNFQNEYSTLADAYKKNELEEDVNLGIFALSSIPVDRAEPSEALRANSVWSTGLQPDAVLISSRQLAIFRSGQSIRQETDVRAQRGAYFIQAKTKLLPNEQKVWYFAADTGKDVGGVADIKQILLTNLNLKEQIERDITAGSNNLRKIIAAADGLQKSGDILMTSRHLSNVMFNVMRGGIFNEGYSIERDDFIRFVLSCDSALYHKQKEFLQNLPLKTKYSRLLNLLAERQNPALERLTYEYLPLTFSRRHGDPSRPWNRFSIDIKDEHGMKVLNYQGNWRDIFQNWEALAFSFPGYLQSMITRFVNASTADGYNPYRLTRDGVDWEILDPTDPWAYIGYWGDHQIIYLLKLMELSHKFNPGRLQNLLLKEIFTYTNVPYRIKPYEEILADPFNTVEFDPDLEELIEKRVARIGSDGKLLWGKDNTIYFVNLTEKLLLPVLVKLSNFIPEGGIWMNTQRPEWNDANNALVGNGISMVTLYYLRRHLVFSLKLFAAMDSAGVSISAEVVGFFQAIYTVLKENMHLLGHSVSDRERKYITDLLSKAGSEYRLQVYRNGFSAQHLSLTFAELSDFCQTTLKWIEHSIRANKREDNLYHAYNLIENHSQGGLSIRYLYEMLEGQAAVLSSGYLSAGEAVESLDALRNSTLFREDQSTYILYPNRRLPRFFEKNIIPQEALSSSKLIQKLLEIENREIITRDSKGSLHFNGALRNSTVLKKALQQLPAELQPLVKKEQAMILKLYEDMFDHQSFTGRSGTFFKYEGLGSIYWHMVSKLLLAVQENYFWAIENKAPSDLLSRLKRHYLDIKEGIGIHKSPDLYGGFPTDPYSHTPAHSGAQQPGMTGQVKEDIISRFGELGVVVNKGRISFRRDLLNFDEFLNQDENFSYYDVQGNLTELALRAGSLAFTIAQVPVVYHRSNKDNIVIHQHNGETVAVQGLTLSGNISASIFNRSGNVERINVFFECS